MGNSRNVRYIVTSTGTHKRDFELEDFITGAWRTKYPDTKLSRTMMPDMTLHVSH